MTPVKKVLALAMMLGSTTAMSADKPVKAPSMKDYNATPWELIKEEDGLRVFSKEVPGSPVMAFSGRLKMKAPLARVYAVMNSQEVRGEWVDRQIGVETIEDDGNGKLIERTMFDMYWPISDRDFVNNTKTTMPAADTVLVQLNSATEVPPSEDFVRAHTWNSSFLLKSVDGGKSTDVTVEIFADPMGLIPKVLVNMIQRNWPGNTLESLERVALSDRKLSGENALEELRKRTALAH